VNDGQVPSTLTDFPALISLSLGSGKVQNTVTVNDASCPADLIFSSDPAGTSLLNWECELWTANTGAGVFWVRYPSISTGSIIYCFYGKPDARTWQGNAPGTWNSTYKGVWHMSNNAANTIVSDSTANGNNAANQTNTNTKSATGEVGNALTYTGSGDYSTAADTPSLQLNTGDFSVELWYYVSAFSAYMSPIGKTAGPGTRDYIVYIANGWEFYVDIGGTAAYVQTSGPPIDISAADYWRHLVLTRVNGAVSIYVNGILFGTASAGGVTNFSSPLVIGKGDSVWDGSIDEVRLYNTGVSSDWVSTAYNNQSDTSSFVTTGVETINSAPNSSSLRGYLIIQ
jgi:hypothetical protein